jgi:phage terminase large subunit
VFLELFGRRDRELVVEGPADTGKSRGCLEKLNAAMTKYPGAKAALVRKTRKSLTSTAMDTFERWVSPEGAARLWGDQEYRYANGSRIYLFGMDDPEKVKSFEGDMIYVQEASELEEEDWLILSTRVTGRGAVMPYQQLIADMNPTYPGFWLYERETLGYTVFLQATHADNPSVTPARIAALDTLTGYLHKRLRLGLRVAAEGMFFEEWNTERHVVDAFDPPVDWTRWTCIDYGFAMPWAVYWLARAPDRRIYVYRELYATGYHDQQQAALIVERSAGERIARHIGDPSMFNKRTEQDKPSIASVYRQHGVLLEPGVNSRIPGWQCFRRALAGERPRLQVMRTRCPNLIRTMPMMVQDPLDPEDLADAVKRVKTEDHAVDAIRYGLMAEEAINQARDLAGLAGTPLPINRPQAPDPDQAQARYIREMIGRG